MIQFIKSATKKSEYPLSDLKQVVIIGRSNVGKSSFINSCFERKIAKVGKTPGKTRLLNFFNVNDEYLLVDVPGYGYAKLSDRELLLFGEMLEEYFDNDKLSIAIMIVDSRHKPSQDDIDMIEFLRFKKIKTIIIANKLDKLKKSEINSKLSIISKTLDVTNEQIITYSSLQPFNKEKILSYINNIINKS